MENTEKNFVENLNYWMKRTDTTQQKLADALNVTRQAVSNYLTGNNLPRMGKVDEICTFFKIKRTDLLDKNVYRNNDLIYKDDDFSIYSETRFLPSSAKPFLKKNLLSMTEPVPLEDTTPTRAEILNWLAEHVRTAAYGGSNYEDFSDEDLLAFYLDIRQEAENN